MNDHLPECRWNWPCRHEDWTHEPMEDNEWVCCECGNDCLCRELESCEQRVHKIAYAEGLGAGRDGHLQHEIGWLKGYAVALDRAREAVDAVPADYKIKGEFQTYSSYAEGRSDFKDGALEAIDALREKT